MKKISIIIGILSLLATFHISAGTIEEKQSIKYLFSINYPVGIDGKKRYLKWIKKIAPILKSFPEVKSIASYDNYYGVNPHRLVEFNFTNIQSATKYWSYPKINKISKDLLKYSSDVKMSVFSKRGDYTNK